MNVWQVVIFKSLHNTELTVFLLLCCCDLHIFRRHSVNAHMWELLANQKWGKDDLMTSVQVSFTWVTRSWSVGVFIGLLHENISQLFGFLLLAQTFCSCTTTVASMDQNAVRHSQSHYQWQIKDMVHRWIVTLYCLLYAETHTQNGKKHSARQIRGHKTNPTLCRFILLSLQQTSEGYSYLGMIAV